MGSLEDHLASFLDRPEHHLDSPAAKIGLPEESFGPPGIPNSTPKCANLQVVEGVLRTRQEIPLEPSWTPILMLSSRRERWFTKNKKKWGGTNSCARGSFSRGSGPPPGGHFEALAAARTLFSKAESCGVRPALGVQRVNPHLPWGKARSGKYKSRLRESVIFMM